ncbi:hypothetical protein KL930_000497 [Ogataea haglerorum]|uniref:Uncharacterized protein n=1 Tax=Ogataea haglerorum TaxID=1937702 RepID=A0AAN6D4J2_9ASCO|nr:uncharacterized protein KL911_000634 [Ogataea haglerorum]KAG7693484.1 hypothetical protein KL951_004505 [Ogataea haglerorum]KAG7701050.1 hypothetical protein KL915_000081 [Ogataea haglerorum]KAG7706044.1 hypothetical protein KL950_003620 [Ogataea haglerorum]KAG7709008.1 hypothetical protein KL914_001398 [Ogataea haglerorum]KAG7713618.1 hypothetical protein KL913_004958 [Ogataea haglerorum]
MTESDTCKRGARLCLNSEKLQRLIELSNWFLDEAYKKGSTSLQAEENLLEYNNYVRASLSCLFSALEQYKGLFMPADEVFIHYKITEILLRETTSLDLASDYCSRGLQLAKRSDSLEYQIRFELLNFEIQYLTDRSKGKKRSFSYFMNIGECCESLNSITLTSIIEYLKIQYFGMIFEEDQIYRNYDRIVERLEANLTEKTFAFLQLALVSQLQFHLFSGSSIEFALEKYNRLKESQGKYPQYMKFLPPQFKAITQILDLLISIQDDDFKSTKSKMSRIDALIRELKALEFWARNFRFCVPVEVKVAEQEFVLPLQINWVTLREFSMLSYFYCGVSYVIKSWDGKNRTEMLFAQCQKYIGYELREHVLISSTEMEAKVLRLKYFGLLINFYQVLAKFQCNQWHSFNREEFPQLFRFIEDYNSGRFSSQELVIYHKFVDKVYFLLALQSQRMNNLDAALHYYLKLREFHSSSSTELNDYNFFSDTILASYKQTTSGVGGCLQEAKDYHNQLYFLATLNLVILTVHNLRHLKLRNVSEFDEDYHVLMDRYARFLKLKNILHDELVQMRTLYKTNVLLSSTLDIFVQYILADEGQPVEFESAHLEKFSQVSPLLLSLVYFVKGETIKMNRSQSELEHLNMKVQLYNQSFKSSCKQSGCGPNAVGYIALKEISNIIEKNQSCFDKEKLDNIQLKIKDVKQGFATRKRKLD